MGSPPRGTERVSHQPRATQDCRYRSIRTEGRGPLGEGMTLTVGAVQQLRGSGALTWLPADGVQPPTKRVCLAGAEGIDGQRGGPGGCEGLVRQWAEPHPFRHKLLKGPWRVVPDLSGPQEEPCGRPPILLAAWAQGGGGTCGGAGSSSPALSSKPSQPPSPEVSSGLRGLHHGFNFSDLDACQVKYFNSVDSSSRSGFPWQWGLTHRSCPTPPGGHCCGLAHCFPDCAVRRSGLCLAGPLPPHPCLVT